ncbi:MAG: hypothetical protein GY951_11120 [Psychromonas sp.]|nr:hypothetical protein [Psychromonas sp.]
MAFCAPGWDSKKIYGEGSVVNYNGIAWQVLKETYGKQYAVVGSPMSLCVKLKF